MRRELNLIRFQMELFEQFAGVTMTKDRVCGEIIGGVHEVGVCRGCFSCSAHSGFCVANDAVVNINQACLEQRCESEDDRGGVAAGIGNETGLLDGVAVELGATVDSLGL